MVVTFSKSKTSKTSSKGKTRVRVVREKSTGKIIRKTYYKSSGEVQQVSYKKGGGTTAVTYKGGKATRYVQTGSKPLTGKALQDAIKAGEEYEKTGMVTKTASAGLNTMTRAGTTPPTVTSTKTSVSPARTNLEIAKDYLAIKDWQGTQLREKEGVRITSRAYQPVSNVVGSGLTTYKAEAGLSKKGRQIASLKPEYLNIEETPQSLQPTKTPLSTAKSRVAGSVPPIDWEGKFGSKFKEDKSRPLSFATQARRGATAIPELMGLTVKGARWASQHVKIEGAGKGGFGIPVLPMVGSPVWKGVSQEERGLQQLADVQRVGIEVEQKMLSERSTGGKIVAEWLPGMSAFKSQEYQERVTTKLVSEGWSPKQAGIGATALTRERKAGATGAVAGAVGAELIGELVGQGLVTRALRKTKLIKGSLGAFGMKQLAPSFFVAGAGEGMAQYGVQKAVQREKPTVLGTLGSGVLGGAIAAPLGSKIATLPASKAKWAMRGVYVVEPLEKAGDVLGAGILKGAGARVPVKVIVPNFMGGGTIFGTVSPTKGKATSMTPTKPFIDITKAPVRTTTAMTTPTSSMTSAFTPALTPAMTPALTPSIVPSSLFIPSFTPTTVVTPRVSTSLTPSLSPSMTPSLSTTPSFTPTFSVVPTVVEDIPFIDFPGGGGYRRRKRGRRRIPTPRARYKPSLAGLFDPKTIAKAPKFVTGVGIRRRVKKKKRGKK